MRAVVFVCSVMVFALVLGTFFFLQQFQPQHNGLVPIEDSTDVNEPDLQRPGENAAQDSASDDDAGYVPGEVLVVVEPGTSVESINEALASFDFVATKDVSNQNFDAGFVVVALAEGANAEHSATTLSLSGLRAQPNYVYTIAEGCDADPLATLLAASFNGGENDYLQSQATVSINDSKHGEQWALDSVDAYRAWSVEKCGNKGGESCFHCRHRHRYRYRS